MKLIAPLTSKPLIFGAKIPGTKFSQLYRLDSDGTNRTRLTREAKDITYPRFSPDGQWIVYRIGYDDSETKFVIDSDGRQKPRRVTKSQEFEWVRDLDEALSPDHRHTLDLNAVIDAAGGKEIKLEGVEEEDPTCWLDSRWIVSVTKDTSDLSKTKIRVHGTDGKLRHEYPLKLSKADDDRFAEEASYAQVWQLHRIPIADKIVLARLGGGNREGKWPVGLLVDLATGQASWWGDFGYSGMFFAPGGKQFVTCLNRKNPKTKKQENALYVASTNAPQKRKLLVSATDLIVADWRGGFCSR